MKRTLFISYIFSCAAFSVTHAVPPFAIKHKPEGSGYQHSRSNHHNVVNFVSGVVGINTKGLRHQPSPTTDCIRIYHTTEGRITRVSSPEGTTLINQKHRFISPIEQTALENAFKLLSYKGSWRVAKFFNTDLNKKKSRS